MKSIFVAFLLLSGTVAYSQEKPIAGFNNEVNKAIIDEDGIQQKLRKLYPDGQPRVFGPATPRFDRSLLDTSKESNARFDSSGVIRLYSNGTYSHSTAKGKVYLMSPDNMPCLVPYTNNGQIPNGFKGGNPDPNMNRMPEVKPIPRKKTNP